MRTPPSPKLQQKALDWIKGLDQRMRFLQSQRAMKSAKKWHWERDTAENLVIGDFIKLSGPSSAIHEITQVTRPRSGYVHINTKRKSGQLDGFLMPENRSLLKGVRDA